MKVCLIHPSDFYTRPQRVLYPFSQGLFYLYSYLRDHAPEVEVEIIDLAHELGVPRTTEEIEKFLGEAETLLKHSGFDVVGITCWTTYNYPASLEIGKLCRRLNPEATIIVGGYHASYMAEDFCFPGSPFDYVVKAEGEKALLDIITGKIPKEAPTQVVQGVPLPMDQHKLRWGECKYHRTLDLLTVWLSRGCPFACGFCADRLTSYRYLSPTAAMAELKRITDTYPQCRTIVIYDPLFGIRRDWRQEFLPMLRDAQLPVGFWAESRVDLLEKEDIDYIKDIRFRMDMGLESVVPEMLAIMKKTTDPLKYLERWRDLDAYMIEKRIPHQLNHIYNYPGETSQTLKQSLDFWTGYYQEAPDMRALYVEPFRFQLMPGSEVYHNWQEYEQKYGAVINNRAWWKQTTLQNGYLSGDLIGSPDLARPEHLNLVNETMVGLTRLVLQHVDRAAFKPFRMQPPTDWEEEYLLTPNGMQYFEERPLRLHPRTALHKSLDGTLSLYNHASHQRVHLNRLGTERLESVLAGSTMRKVGETLAHYPNLEVQLDKLRMFFSDLLAGGYLVLGLPEPPARPALTGRPRVKLRTTIGELTLELFADEAPRLVANFLYLIAQGFYDSLRFDTESPYNYTALGAVTRSGLGPGYSLLQEESGIPIERGTVAMVPSGLRLHGSLVRFYRQPFPEETSYVFGRVVDGWDTLEAILNSDTVLGIEVSAAPRADYGQLPGGRIYSQLSEGLTGCDERSAARVEREIGDTIAVDCSAGVLAGAAAGEGQA